MRTYSVRMAESELVADRFGPQQMILMVVFNGAGYFSEITEAAVAVSGKAVLVRSGLGGAA